MQRYADTLFAAVASLTREGLKPEASRMVMNVVEVAIQGCPLDLYFGTFVESGLFFKILAAVIDDDVPHRFRPPYRFNVLWMCF